MKWAWIATKFPLRLVCRRERWVLTAQGWLAGFTCLVLLTSHCLGQTYPFLAINRPLPASILVVEGWSSDRCLEAALGEFQRHSYRYLVTTGGPLKLGGYLVNYKSFADLAAATLIKLGADRRRLVILPAPDTLRDRTYTSALVLKKWLQQTDLSGQGVNVFTVGPHARRSWLLFRKALVSEPVGILANSDDLDYDPHHWWASSSGFRSILSELLAYFYALVFTWTR
ncbi:MAG: YdcF family protein [Cyanobacteria bacterium REEB459]|nr:YdcF family protein [Cyanobacteria bacterium REEB459]